MKKAPFLNCPTETSFHLSGFAVATQLHQTIFLLFEMARKSLLQASRGKYLRSHFEKTTSSYLKQREAEATEIALTEAGRPNATVYVDAINEESMGELIMFSQYFTAYTAEFYDINAFDQPGVEYGKKLTFAMMGRQGFAEYNQRIESIQRRKRAIVPTTS